VQVLDEFLMQNVAAAAERPVLGFIQFAPVGDVRGDQLALFVRRERRRIVRLLKRSLNC